MMFFFYFDQKKIEAFKKMFKKNLSRILRAQISTANMKTRINEAKREHFSMVDDFTGLCHIKTEVKVKSQLKTNKIKKHSI